MRRLVRRPRALGAAGLAIVALVVSLLQEAPPAATPGRPPGPAATPGRPPGPAATPGRPPGPAPAGLVEGVTAGLQDPRFESATVGLAVWVEGSGMVLTHNADVALSPGSNEKLLVAWGAYGVIGPGTVLETEVRADGDIDGSTLRGDLVIVGGGDPTLRSTGAHSLDRLAAQVRARGVTEVSGDLVADESRFDAERTAPGWAEHHMPVFVGPLSALAVDRNLLRTDPEYLANPALGNAGAFREALARHGVTVAGGDRVATAPAASAPLASVSSAPVGDLVAEMLTHSDNFYAEMLLKEVGWRAAGLGTLENGMGAVHELAAASGVRLTARAADGSGLSRHNSRPPREWAELLVAGRSQPWFGELLAGLAVGARTGTLANRFHGTPAAGNLRAKTGWVRGSRALSGYVTTSGGRHVVFSLVVNSSPVPSAVIPAMDDLVAAMAASPG